ncbi:DUF3817 domain-containing protein [Nesterenkonia marinintestina]|uniref:DUF3817 domain-containing protein n=1 Tax=Nesterenkonia marinintestina TaxID=2979865 RepID=UPI0021C1ED66|nr:DUF3817 domain-containing protein [Nesterenkonia sp. GX14115]
MFRAPKDLFRVMAFAEAVSWTLLIGGMILRATHDLDVAVTVGGGIHGFVFLAYGATAVIVAKNQRWGPVPAAVAIVSAVIPYATVPTHFWLSRSGRLEGDWRHEPTDHSRDHTWHDRLLRALLHHPVKFGIGISALVILTYVVLLQVGPPVDISPEG